MSRDHDYWVYMMSNNTRSTRYIGVTNNLRVRVAQHRSGERTGFARDYHCVHLVYLRPFSGHSRRDCQGEAIERLATREEKRVDRGNKSALG